MTPISVTSQPTNLVRRGVLGAYIAAIALAFSGVTQLILVYPTKGPGELGSLSAYLIESAHAVAWAGMILAFIGLRALHGKSFGRLGNLAFFLGVFGNAFMILDTIGVLIFAALGTGEEAFAPGTIGETIANWMILPGFVTLFVWIPIMGIASWRAKVIPRWCAVLLIIHTPFVFFLIASYGFGGIVLGMLWLLVGLALRSQQLYQHLPDTLRQQQIV